MIILGIAILIVLVLLLAQAKRKTAAVERSEQRINIAIDDQQHGPAMQIEEVPAEIVRLARKKDNQNTIEAIKRYRAQFGVDLRTAKERIERLQQGL